MRKLAKGGIILVNFSFVIIKIIVLGKEKTESRGEEEEGWTAQGGYCWWLLPDVVVAGGGESREKREKRKRAI